MAPRKKASSVHHQDDNDICIDLAKLAQQVWTAEEQQTTAPAVQQPSKKLNCDLSPGTLTGVQDGIAFRNYNIAGPSLFKQNRQKKVNHNSPHDTSRIYKTIRLPKEPARQRKHSKNWIGSRDKPITVDDSPASRCFSTPNKTSDPNPHYEVAQAFSFSRSIPPMDPNLVKTCPKPPPAALMFDQKAYFPYQLDMARHLAYNGVSGPYELGEYLVDIYRGTAQPVKIARRDTDEYGQPVWRHLITGDRIQPQDGSNISGKPVALSTGVLLHMEDTNSTTIAPEWTFSQPREWHSQEKPEKEKLEKKQHSAQQEANPIHPGLKPGCNPMWH
jgi:hypothetical protein